jgi:thiamine kinase-like enzyme
VGELDTFMEQLEAVLGPADGAAVPLQGGITNHNYRVSFAGRECVVRLPGKETVLLGISRHAERAASEMAARLRIAPRVVAAEPGCLVTEFVASEPLSAAQVRAEAPSIARALRAFHDGTARLPVGFWVPDLLDAYAGVVRDRGGSLGDDYALTQELVGRIAEALPLTEPVPCHNDLLPANLLRVADGRVLIVDWEYAGMGHRMFDLGNLAVNNDFDAEAEMRLLGAYFGEPPDAPRRAALKLMRMMSDAREAAWGVIQSAISELDFDFRDYASRHFARLERAAGDPDFEEWLSAAAA